MPLEGKLPLSISSMHCEGEVGFDERAFSMDGERHMIGHGRQYL